MPYYSSECLVLSLSEEVDALINYQKIVFERILKSINPHLKIRLAGEAESAHKRLKEIYDLSGNLNSEQLNLSSRLLHEQSKRAFLRSSSLRLTCS